MAAFKQSVPAPGSLDLVQRITNAKGRLRAALADLERVEDCAPDTDVTWVVLTLHQIDSRLATMRGQLERDGRRFYPSASK